MIDIYIYVIIALLPLSAGILVFQTNPYNALIIRGILGAIAALTYSILGAPDVALTEALMGTLLAITLYAVAVRSSMVLMLGVIKDEQTENDRSSIPEVNGQWGDFLGELQTIFDKFYLRIELVKYDSRSSLEQALIDKEIHALCFTSEATEKPMNSAEIAIQQDGVRSSYQIKTRVPRLYDIMTNQLSNKAIFEYINVTPNKAETHS